MREPIVNFVAAMPPPTHGQSTVNKLIYRALYDANIHINLFNIAPKYHNKARPAYHLSRMLNVFKAVVGLISKAPLGTQRVVTYCVYESGLGYIYNLIITITAWLLGHKIYLHHHTSEHTIAFSLRYFLFCKLFGSRITHVVLCTSMKEDLTRLYLSKSQVLVLNNAIACEEFCSAPEKFHIDSNPAPELTRIGMLSNLTVEKGTLTFISTARAVNELSPTLKFTLAGPLSDAACMREVKACIVAPRSNTEYIGPVYGEAKAQFFTSLKYFYFPTHYRFEAQPLVILEAMRYGIPVISSNAGYISDLVGEAGFIVNGKHESIGLLKGLHSNCSTNEEYWSSLSTRARHRYDELLSDSRRELSELIIHIKNAGVSQP